MEKVMYYADIAEDYYNVACPEHVQNGYEKNVLIDTETEECLFVPGEVIPQEGELLFRCRRTKGNTVITLKTPKRKKLEKRNDYQRFKGIIRENTQEGTNYVSLPSEISHLPICGTKIENWDDFLELALTPDERYKNAYAVLQELDELVVSSQKGFLGECFCIPYVRHEYPEGYYCFSFSHFELMLDNLLCAVYEFNGSAN